jgi:hypothetical protein
MLWCGGVIDVAPPNKSITPSNPLAVNASHTQLSVGANPVQILLASSCGQESNTRQHVTTSSGLSDVPQAARYRHRQAVRQMRWQVPGLRLIRQAHYPSAHLRRVQLRQLSE